MSTSCVVFGKGGYRYIPAVFQYSSGVAAEAGFEIERARLLRPLPLADGFAFAERHLSGLGRPSTAFAACELRSAAPFTEQGFHDFNREYVKTLARWASTKTRRIRWRAPTSVLRTASRGAGALRVLVYGSGFRLTSRRFHRRRRRRGARRHGELSRAHGALRRNFPDAMREKVRHVVEEMEQRLAALGFSWQDAVSTQAYTVQDIGALVGPEIAARGAAPGGLSWHFARPPVEGLEFEMDVRGPAREITSDRALDHCRPTGKGLISSRFKAR